MIDQRGRWVVGETPILGIRLQWAHLVLKVATLVPLVMLLFAALLLSYKLVLLAVMGGVALAILLLLVRYRLQQLCSRGPLWVSSNGVLIDTLLERLKAHGYPVGVKKLALNPHLKNIVDAYLRTLIRETGNHLKDHIRSGPEMRDPGSFKRPLAGPMATRVRRDADQAAVRIASLLSRLYRDDHDSQE